MASGSSGRWAVERRSPPAFQLSGSNIHESLVPPLVCSQVEVRGGRRVWFYIPCFLPRHRMMVVCTCGSEVWEEKDPDSGRGSFLNEIQMAERSCSIPHVKARGLDCGVEGVCQRWMTPAGHLAPSSEHPQDRLGLQRVQAIFQHLTFVSPSFFG